MNVKEEILLWYLAIISIHLKESETNQVEQSKIKTNNKGIDSVDALISYC